MENQSQNNKDVTPSQELEKMLNVNEDISNNPHPETGGTGGNRPVFNGESLVITKDDDETDAE